MIDPLFAYRKDTVRYMVMSTHGTSGIATMTTAFIMEMLLSVLRERKGCLKAYTTGGILIAHFYVSCVITPSQFLMFA